MKRYYAVTGRICGRDEDEVHICEAASREEAAASAADAFWQLDNKPEYRERAENNGEGVFINQVFMSDSPIVPAYR